MNGAHPPFPLFSPSPSETLPVDEQRQLILGHMEYVKQVARSILRRLPASVQLDDLIQAGSVGLIDAAKRFRPHGNLPFGQYARIRITGAIFDSLRELDWASRYFRTRQQKLDNTTRALESKLGRKPDSDEVADSLGMDLNTFYEFAQAVQNIQEVELEPQDDRGNWMPMARQHMHNMGEQIRRTTRSTQSVPGLIEYACDLSNARKSRTLAAT